MGGDTRKKILTLAALAVIVAAVAWTLVPFHDGHVRCDDAVTSALHGEPAVLNPTGYPLLSGSEAKGVEKGDLGFGERLVVACRGQARLRVGLAAGAIVATIVGLSVVWQPATRKRSVQLVENLKRGRHNVGKLLRAIGVVIVLGGIVMGIWLQTGGTLSPGRFATYERLAEALTALTPTAIGFVLIGVGHALALYEDQNRTGSSG